MDAHLVKRSKETLLYTAGALACLFPRMKLDEDQRKKEEKDERKRKYNVKWSDEVTAEDMEAYRLKRIHHDDPMKDFLH
ncbi:hypothetical protein M5K25_010259 [Dendrobium thyrsiflorum]|uniref:Uncharacterized protein n=1 Tax=Dendrobium thyrsiflorum TaxID=117978 RepID=A0ABD0V0G2_DENTH